MLHYYNLHLLPTRRPLHFPGVTLPSKRELLTGRTTWVGSLKVRIPRTARVKIPLLDVDENFWQGVRLRFCRRAKALERS